MFKIINLFQLSKFGLSIYACHLNYILESNQVYHAQSMVHLMSGNMYYATVKAITGAGNVLESCSNGITLDTTPPDAWFVQVGSEEAAVVDDVIYQKQADNIFASWNVTDGESGVATTNVWDSSAPG